MYVAILASLFVAQIQTGQDLLAACTARDTAACDAFIRQTLTASEANSCFKSVAMADTRADVVHELRANEKQANGANLRQASDLVAELLAKECSSAE